MVAIEARFNSPVSLLMLIDFMDSLTVVILVLKFLATVALLDMPEDKSFIC